MSHVWLAVARYVAVSLGVIIVLLALIGVRYIPHGRVGLIEKLWSFAGSLREGRIIATKGEAGFQSAVLRGGLYVGYPFWQYRIRCVPLVAVSEGKIGYVYARDGVALSPMQTLAHIVPSNSFQDAGAFLENGGQRGRQRQIMREGVYAINTALFVVITENRVYTGPGFAENANQYGLWQSELIGRNGFNPVVVGQGASSTSSFVPEMTTVTPSSVKDAHAELLPHDNLGVIIVHDGPSLDPGEVIAPQIVGTKEMPGHDYFQDPEAFLALGGRRGKQLQVLTDGTYFINRWFATVELKPKTLIPIGYVGVVISYYGRSGVDVTGAEFRYGEQVNEGERGVWREALRPGKYALNPYALKVELVPTVNFVLRWISGQMEAHRYDEQLSSIPLITADAYEPLLPLSLVLHIDYEKAPRVIQRFGDVRRLISQTLDPILTAYFRDVAQSSNMLDLLTHREEIQRRATEELGKRFANYDINCVAVLIGRPESQSSRDPEDAIGTLFNQLRSRRLAEEQKETYAKQQEAVVRLKELNHAKAEADQQTQLTQTRVAVEIAANRGAAELAEAERLAKRDVARAEGEARSKELLGHGESARIAQIGQAEAEVNRQKVAAFGDARIYALNLIAERLSQSQQPLVPERLVVLGGEDNANSNITGLVQSLLTLMLSEKSGIGVQDDGAGHAEAPVAAIENAGRKAA